MPDQRLASLHLTIEYAVSRTLQRFKNLQDKDIEWVFEQYRNYFQALRQGKDVSEPDSTRRSRSELMDYLWECLIKWEEAGGPDDLLDGSFRPGGRPVTMVEELYVMGFNDLRKSCRMHRRANGPRGYVKFVQEFIADTLAKDPTLEELLDPEIPAISVGLDFQPLLEKRGYQITMAPDYSGDDEVDHILFELEEEASLTEIEKLLKRYPNNQLLRAEYAVQLKGADRVEEAIMEWENLLKNSPQNPHYLSAYIGLWLHEDNDRGFEEAERLDFQFELDKYPFDTSEGYSIVALLMHSSACITMALYGKDIAYALELFDDLVRTGLPIELLQNIGSEFILYGLRGLDTTEKEEYVAVDDLPIKFPQFSAATDFIEVQWEAVAEELVNKLTPAGHNYPNAFTQEFPWPRDPGTVESALQLRVHILDSAPEIYRTIVVPDDTLLPDLHGMLQVAFDWEESHLHEFIHEGVHFEMPHEAVPTSGVDSRSVRVGELLKKVGDEMVYHYDFGDSWKHLIVLEAIPEVDDEILYPRCLAGARRGPKEDSGGIHRYQHILKVLEDPEHPEYTDLKAWLGPDFDPAEFVLAWTHKQLWKGRFWSLGAEE